jgi:hypothetical protein
MSFEGGELWWGVAWGVQIMYLTFNRVRQGLWMYDAVFNVRFYRCMEGYLWERFAFEKSIDGFRQSFSSSSPS